MKMSDVNLPSNRRFGLFFTGVFAISGAYFSSEDNMTAAVISVGLSVLMLATSLFKADNLAPLNKAWMRFGLLLGKIVSPIVLGILFFGVFTAIGFGMRLFGRDELRLNIKSRSSHWKPKVIVGSSLNTFENQF